MSPPCDNDIQTLGERLDLLSLSSTFLPLPDSPPPPRLHQVKMMRERNITFAGRGRESAEDYIDSVEAYTIACGIQDPQEKEVVKRATFKEGLRGEALEWWQGEVDRDTKKNWDLLSEKFLERFPEGQDSTIQFTIVREVVDFARRGGEPLSEFLKRAEKLHRRTLDPKLRVMLTNQVLAKMVDGEVDLTLKTRVEDILFTQGRLLPGRVGVREDCKFDVVISLIRDCSSSYGQRMNTDDLYASDNEDGDPDVSQRKVLESIARTMEKVGNQMSSLSVQNSSPPIINPNSYQRPATSKNFACFNCGQSGHGAWECSMPRDNDVIARRRAAFNGSGGGPSGGRQSDSDQPRDRSPAAGARAVMHQNELTQQAFTDLCNEIREHNQRRNARHASYMLQEAPSVVAGVKDNRVSKPEKAKPKIILRRGSQGSQGQRHETPPTSTPKTVHFEDLPGRDEPGDLMEHEPSPRIIEVQDEVSSPMQSPQASSSKGKAPADQEKSQVGSRDMAPSLRDIIGKYDMEEIRKFLREVGAERRKAAGPQPRTRPLIKGMADYNVPLLDIGAELSKMNLNVNFVALLQAAPGLRADLNRLMGPAVKANRNRQRGDTPAQANPHAGEGVVAFLDTALTPDEVPQVRVGFVEALVDGVVTNRAMLDNGSTMDLISPPFMRQIGATPRNLTSPMGVKLANDMASSVSQYVLVEVEVGGIFCCLMAYVLGDGHTFDILLSQSWYYRVRAIQDWGRGMVTVFGRTGTRSDVRLVTGPGMPVHCEPEDEGHHPEIRYDIPPERDEDVMQELSDVLEYLDSCELTQEEEGNA